MTLKITTLYQQLSLTNDFKNNNTLSTTKFKQSRDYKTVMLSHQNTPLQNALSKFISK